MIMTTAQDADVQPVSPRGVIIESHYVKAAGEIVKGGVRGETAGQNFDLLRDGEMDVKEQD